MHERNDVTFDVSNSNFFKYSKNSRFVSFGIAASGSIKKSPGDKEVDKINTFNPGHFLQKRK